MVPLSRRLPWIALLLAAASLAGCGGQARMQADCDELLQKGKYNDVIDECKSPYHRSSAYLGLAGFDIFDLLDSTADPGDVVAILGLTVSNIDSKRVLINKAVKEVKNPKSGSEAFALLVSSFLGFAVTVEQFLDNGTGATALDYTFDSSEIAAALDIQVQAPLVLVAPPATDYYAAVSGNAAYTLNCSGDVTGSACDTDPDTLVYGDASGAGILDTASPPAESGNKSAVISAVPSLAGAYPVQMLNLALPYKFSAAQQPAVSDFLGKGGVGGVFDIGLGGYLQYLGAADDALAEFGGVPPGQTAISDDIDGLVLQFDNGGLKASDGTACASGDAVAAGLTAAGVSGLEFVYAAAAGTLSSPVPSSVPGGYYKGRNLAAASDVAGVTAFGTLAPIPAGTAFSSLNRYKVLFPTTSGMVAFTPGNATGRVDQAYAAFVTEFENIPLVLPAVPTADDGQINVIELLCSAE